MAKKFIVGIDLGGTNLKIGLLDLKYNIKLKIILTTKRFFKKEELIWAIINSVNNIIQEKKLKKSEILGIGLGLPGPVNEKSGIVHFFPNIPGWREVNLKQILQERLKLPVALDNDAKLMCLAEYKLGAAKGFKNALCLTLGTGVGSGLIIEGELYRGANNASGEIGHMPINENGPRCNCQRIACLESYIGNNRIIKQARRVFKRAISLEELSGLAKKTCRPSGRQNKQALNIWLKVGAHLGIALAGIVNLLNLDAIVIGVGVSNAGPILFGKVRKTISQRAMSVQAKSVKIVKAQLGNNAGMIGAALLVRKDRVV